MAIAQAAGRGSLGHVDTFTINWEAQKFFVGSSCSSAQGTIDMNQSLNLGSGRIFFSKVSLARTGRFFKKNFLYSVTPRIN